MQSLAKKFDMHSLPVSAYLLEKKSLSKKYSRHYKKKVLVLPYISLRDNKYEYFEVLLEVILPVFLKKNVSNTRYFFKNGFLQVVLLYLKNAQQ